MALFVDREVPVDSNSIQLEIAWHAQSPILAIGSYSEERGGYVRVIETSAAGALVNESDSGAAIPPHPTAQVSSLSWHPVKLWLCVGWENGELYLYDHSKSNCMKVETLHQSAVFLLRWSAAGSRLVSADRIGSAVGWRIDSEGRMSVIFHHELKDELKGLVFCSEQPHGDGLDLSNLARAAVSGDEKALDMFSVWQPGGMTVKPGHSSLLATNENLNCYAGSSTGVVYYLNQNGSCMEVLQADGPIRYVFHHKENDLIIIITESMVIGQFQMDTDGSLVEVAKIKVSTRSKENHACWAGAGVLAIATGETSVRIWDLKTDDNFVLPSAGGASSEVISSMSFCSEKNILAAGTNAGTVLMWRFPTNKVRPTDTDWKALPKVPIGPTIRTLSWGGGNRYLAINCVRQVFILTEQELAVGYCDEVSAMQKTPSQVIVKFHGNKGASSTSEATSKLDVQIQVSSLRVTKSHIMLVGSGKVITYEVQKEISHLMSVGEFYSSCNIITTCDNSIYTLEKDRIHIRSFQGTIKHTLHLTESEGEGVTLDASGNHIVCSTRNGAVKIWDISKREARAIHAHPIMLKEKIPDFGHVLSLRVSVNVSHLSLVVRTASDGSVDPKLYIFDVERDVVRFFNFASGRNETDDSLAPPNSAQSYLRSVSPNIPSSSSSTRSNPSNNSSGHSKTISNRFVINHMWDAVEPNFLVCLTKSSAIKVPTVSDDSTGDPYPEKTTLVSLFIHEDLGVVVHDSHPCGSDSSGNNTLRLISVEIPFMITLANKPQFESKDSKPDIDDPQKAESDVIINRVVMNDFVGLEESDKATRDAVIKFSFFLSIGNMEEAFKSIKTIKNQNVWGNLARMCVKSQRLDVAAICLGNMEHAAGARALRQISATSEDKDVKTAVLAIYLNMPEEAERLFIKCKRYDMLNKLYQDSNQWEKALEVAANNDRIHLRATFYNFAKHLEKRGDISGAIHNFEKSETHRFEVPRLLFEDWNMLETYIQKSNDKDLKRWWAQYMESTGEMELALQYYELAEDYLSLVRVYCYCDNLERAAEIANSSGDKAACYHLARQYENVDNINEAIHFFSKAQAYSNAIRICKDQGFNEQLWSLAILAGPNEKLDAAKYFENSDKPQFDKAVILYEKAGYVGKAMELAFEKKQHNVLQYISTNFNENTDPLLLDKTAGFFLEHQQYEKAVDLYVASVQAIKALELCLQYNIQITDEMADKLSGDTSEKKDEGNVDQQQRIAVLNRIAEVAYQQGNYHLATKKWTQAGNKLQAMKSLLKSGDTEKIIFFANVSRQKEIYILAGNYLQTTLDWRNNSDIMKSIITFYNKSKAYDLLAMFYYACADVEIDEYQNYEKAQGALSECLKCFSKCDEQTDGIKGRIIQVTKSLDLIGQFVDYQALYSKNASKAIEGCKSLLKEPNINASVRQGDIYGFMIEHYAKLQNCKQALNLVHELRTAISNVNLEYYINNDALEAIEKKMGVVLRAENNEPDKYDEDEG